MKMTEFHAFPGLGNAVMGGAGAKEFYALLGKAVAELLPYIDQI